ncbi:Crp/Fnr family transcriptional regulator [Aquimarina longa]|uniref:Crp/Fnr family transcriptional regulator n=1 Tax=Aquimarina longa TaxID=1080221 RepID=UPI000783F868|nr:Crp/Fnr family transcriptional regulator [Aquimarina longa]
MNKQIIEYLSKYTVITKELEDIIAESTFFKNYKKGTILLSEGNLSNECFFVLKGCIRSYFFKEGEEKTIEFYTEEQVVTPANYGKSTPSKYYLECIEDTVLNVANPTIENEMFQKYPQLESLSRIIAEEIITKHQTSFTEFKTSNPEERYLHLLKTRPNIIQRAPQYQIASYLGIKPESLSRIKKRLMNKMNSSI